MNHKKALVELVNCIQLRRPGAFIDEEIYDSDLEEITGKIKREMELARSEDAYAGTKEDQVQKKYYFGLCMAQTVRGMTEIFIDEHPLVWIERKRDEMKAEGIRGVMVLQFFSEIPGEVYHEMKEREQKQIITPPEKKLVFPG
jgi:hypothetical protein